MHILESNVYKKWIGVLDHKGNKVQIRIIPMRRGC